jgi:hypothetical protein
MVVIECPWCEGPAELRASSVDCPDCGIRVDVADDEPALELIAA